VKSRQRLDHQGAFFVTHADLGISGDEALPSQVLHHHHVAREVLLVEAQKVALGHWQLEIHKLSKGRQNLVEKLVLLVQQSGAFDVGDVLLIWRHRLGEARKLLFFFFIIFQRIFN